MEPQDEVFNPSFHGELCLHNGENPNYEIACDECDFYQICFPDWKEALVSHDINPEHLQVSASGDEFSGSVERNMPFKKTSIAKRLKS